MTLLQRLFTLAAALLLAACAGPKYTVDDGRKVDETLLAGIRAYGAGERLIRPAIARSAELHDKDCDKQWELPFAVATSQGWSDNDRVAWVRGLQVDERLTVIAVTQDSPVKLGERFIRIDGRENNNAESMLEVLAEVRDAGRPFGATVAPGRHVEIKPFQVCRGYTRLAPPNTPKLQDYHWLLSMHPLEITQADLTPDEALWTVLWTQGLSEEGGARMKTYHYAVKIAGALYNLATLASGVKAAAFAAEQAVSAARNAAASAASTFIRDQLIKQGQDLATAKLREGLTEMAQNFTKQQTLNALQAAAANRGSLSGVSRVAATVFERADAWAMQRMSLLKASPLVGFQLHQKMIERGLTANALLFDAERLDELSKLAAAQGLEPEVQAILRGFRASELLAEIGAMPLASAQAGFSFESVDDPGAGRFSRGLVDALLEIPVESGKPR